MSAPTLELGTEEWWKRLRVDPAGLARDVCSIDLVNLEQTLQQHAALRAWVGAAFESARVREERTKWELEKARAQALITSQGIDPQTNKTKTVAVLEALVELDPTVQQWTATLLEFQEVRGVLHAVSSALEDRKDMLIQIAAKHRQESGTYR